MNNSLKTLTVITLSKLSLDQLSTLLIDFIYADAFIDKSYVFSADNMQSVYDGAGVQSVSTNRIIKYVG